MVRYRPITLQSFYAAVEHDARERFWQMYTADTLYLIARNAYAARGMEYPLEAFSTHESRKNTPQDTRNAYEIADDIASHLMGGNT